MIALPATIEVTPVFVIVTAPVAPLTPIPVPATFEVTPVFAIVTPVEPLYDVPLNPVPIVKVAKLEPNVMPLIVFEPETTVSAFNLVFTSVAKFVVEPAVICAEPDTKFGMVILAEPLNEVPLIVLAVANVVAVDALPVNAPVNPVDVTEVKPAMVVAVPPNVIAVEPIVTVLEPLTTPNELL